MNTQGVSNATDWRWLLLAALFGGASVLSLCTYLLAKPLAAWLFTAAGYALIAAYFVLRYLGRKSTATAAKTMGYTALICLALAIVAQLGKW